jgi:hypothetical protein
MGLCDSNKWVDESHMTIQVLSSLLKRYMNHGKTHHEILEEDNTYGNPDEHGTPGENGTVGKVYRKCKWYSR